MAVEHSSHQEGQVTFPAETQTAHSTNGRPPRLLARVSIALLFLCGVIDMNDRMSISLYAHVVQQQAALTDAQLAIVLSSVTSLASLLFSLPMGRAADKLPGAPLLARTVPERLLQRQDGPERLCDAILGKLIV